MRSALRMFPLASRPLWGCVPAARSIDHSGPAWLMLAAVPGTPAAEMFSSSTMRSRDDHGTDDHGTFTVPAVRGNFFPKMTFPHQFHRVFCHVMVFISTLGHRESLGLPPFWRHELNFFEFKNVLLFEIKTFRNPSGTSSFSVW